MVQAHALMQYICTMNYYDVPWSDMLIILIILAIIIGCGYTHQLTVH